MPKFVFKDKIVVRDKGNFELPKEELYGANCRIRPLFQRAASYLPRKIPPPYGTYDSVK